MTPAFIHLAVSTDGDVVAVERDPGVPEEFWLLLRAEWGSVSRDVAMHVDVPVERFLSRTAWLPEACRRYRVGIDWDERSRSLLAGAQAERDRLRELLRNAPVPSPDLVEAQLTNTRFARTLRNFQLRDLSTLVQLPNGANFSVPGSGKTTVTYALYELERNAGRVERMLVVAPLSAFDSWIREAVACFADPPTVCAFDGSMPAGAEVLLVNYQRLAANYQGMAAWVSERPTQVVLDEAHRMKRGRGGLWGNVCLDLAYLSARRDILTGTPAPNTPSDLEALLNFLWPNQARRILPPDVLVPRPFPRAVARTGEILSPLFVRATKNELDLPPVRRRVEQIELDGIHRDIYLALLDQYAGGFQVTMTDRLSFAAMGRVTMYLLEAATNPALLPVGASRFDAVEFQHPPLTIPPGSRLAQLIADYGRYETPRKLIRLGQLVRSNAEAGRKTLVWSNFVRNLEALKRMLNRYEPAMIHGGVPADPGDSLPPPTRETEIHRFRNDENCFVLLANPAAMSEGISLHDVCHDAIYVERTFNAGQFLQSVDRIHRLGLPPEQETRITFLITDGTIDDVVDNRVAEKAERLSLLMSDPGLITLTLPDDEDYGPVMDTQQDVEELFRHLRGEDV